MTNYFCDDIVNHRTYGMCKIVGYQNVDGDDVYALKRLETGDLMYSIAMYFTAINKRENQKNMKVGDSVVSKIDVSGIGLFMIEEIYNYEGDLFIKVDGKWRFADDFVKIEPYLEDKIISNSSCKTSKDNYSEVQEILEDMLTDIPVIQKLPTVDKVKIDAVNPSHYRQGKIECIDAIESATVNKTGIEAVCTANVIKYLWRYEAKNGLVDAEKMLWYANKLKKVVEEREKKKKKK